MDNKKPRLDLKDISNKLEVISKKAKSDVVKLEALDRGTRGDRTGYDFTGTGNFFREDWDKKQKLYHQIRGVGILGRYIKEESKL